MRPNSSCRERRTGLEAPERLPNAGEPQTDAVARVYQVLGNDAVLLPLPKGRKGCVRTGWTTTTLSESKMPEYQATLAAGDIAILLGRSGNKICTIDCDGDEAADNLITANPWLATTLRTRGARGCNFWMRVRGEIPKSCNLLVGEDQVGEWRADGNATKIWGTHPDTGGLYQWLVTDAPASIAFDQIVWPHGWGGGCIKSDLDRLVDQHGPPFNAGKTGIQLNQPFFAAKFAHENHVLFEADENRFYLYDDGRGLWTHATEAGIKTRLIEELMNYSRAQDEKIRTRIQLARTDPLAANIARMLRGQVEKRGVFLNPRKIVHVLNGVLEVGKTATVTHKFSPDFYSRNQIPVPFDPGATCPRFTGELLEPALSRDDIILLQKWVGGVLLGGNLAQKLLIQEGLAGTGKTTFATVVEMLIGPASVTQLRTELLNERFEMGRFVGKRLLAGRDVPGDFLSRRGASVLKALTGGDSMNGEIKGSMIAPSLGFFDVIVTTNCRLRVRLDEDIGAWERRLLIVPYHRARPAKPVPEFAALLFKTEGSGILNWALDGAAALLSDLDVHGSFQVTADQKKRVAALLAESDSVRAFLRAKVSRTDGQDLTSEELGQAYNRFCEAMEWTPQLIRDVERQLPDLMLALFNVGRRNDVDRQGRARKGYSGVALNRETDDHAA